MCEQLKRQLLAFRKYRKLPFAGRGYGSKKDGLCPHCGSRRYVFRGRWKVCMKCGYDRLEEHLVAFNLGRVKRNQPIDAQSLQRNIEYLTRVFLGPDVLIV